MLVTALGRTGYHVEAAADGQKAAELPRKRPFHLIVSDLRLPHVSGIELLKIPEGLLTPLSSPVQGRYADREVSEPDIGKARRFHQSR